jgi:hypothetical protein
MRQLCGNFAYFRAKLKFGRRQASTHDGDVGDVARQADFFVADSWRAVYHDLVAEQTNLGVALDIDGFVFAQPARESLSEFGFADGEQWAGF